jgi:ribosomal protein L31E
MTKEQIEKTNELEVVKNLERMLINARFWKPAPEVIQYIKENYDKHLNRLDELQMYSLSRYYERQWQEAIQ